jgi:Anti-sigma factor NepR
MQHDLPTRKHRGRLGRDVQNKLGQQLRTAYDDIVSEGVPDRFNELLRRLDEDKGSG